MSVNGAPKGGAPRLDLAAFRDPALARDLIDRIRDLVG